MSNVEGLVRDVSLMNLDSLQLPELSTLAIKANLSISEQLFSQWLSLPYAFQLATSLLADAKAKAGESGSTVIATKGAGNHVLHPAVFSAGSTPPLSPRNISASPRISKPRIGPSSLGSSSIKLANDRQQAIPQFYFQNGRPISEEMKEQCLSEINTHFKNSPDGLREHEFKPITKEICKLPSFFSKVLFEKIDKDETGVVTSDKFIDYWITGNLLTMDLVTRIFTILAQPDHNYLTQRDFVPLLREILATHPGLEFLQDTPEFQERYAETVIYRIFYCLDRSGNGRITLRDLKRGDLITAMHQIDEEEDINKVLRYFSYEHFYVVYCKFWELDTNHDFLIDKDNLIRYGNHALTYRIVDRIFSQVPRKFTSNVEGKMCYEDFVYFILSEEDKASEPGLKYWFNCIDLDGNGALTANEMQFFYEEQLHRMECMSQEAVVFEDILCQIFDMIKPESNDRMTLRDLKGSKLSAHIFNILFNLNKFIAFESRDPFLIRLIPKGTFFYDYYQVDLHLLTPYLENSEGRLYIIVSAMEIPLLLARME
ncbi:hypothetical protein Tsubulata_001690 [Turnera subulata]|uniref:EF-hand domain-containing protein n=1 Tax=Turnera subulata TaxID=218843 RepID=A0A9Q0J9G2_9ROSI|nr:hypothetical protein Tsubulata_001690 [Turnera subulata]